MIRLGVIGAGAWVQTSHLPVLRQYSSDVEFVAVCRRGAEDVEKVRRAFGFEIGTEDYREVLAAGVDVCIVASPTALHYEHARAALLSGAHVLVEKPFTVIPSHAWDLVNVAARAHRHLLVSFGWNYRPMTLRVREALGSIRIGEIEAISIHMGSTMRELLSDEGSYPALKEGGVQPDSETWTNPALSGGGYAHGQLSHALGVALMLTGLRASHVFALMNSPRADPRIDFHDAISIRFAGGAIGTLSGTSVHRGVHDNKHQLEIRVVGANGQYHIDFEREWFHAWSRDGDELTLHLSDGDGTYDCIGPPLALIEMARTGSTTSNYSPGELGARTVEILDAAYRSAKSGRLEGVN